MTCPECGGTVKARIQGQKTYVISCISCEWSVATTSISSLEEDTTIYTLYLEKDQQLHFEQLLVVAKISGMNVLQVKKACDASEYLIFKGLATEVLAVKEKLEEQQIGFIVVPTFDY